jgi:hypothetical protein
MLSEDRAVESPLYGRVVFLVATPETGAERLQRGLAALPGAVAPPAPTHVFSQGLGEVLDRWVSGEEMIRRFVRRQPDDGTLMGFRMLSGLADAETFLSHARTLGDALLSPALGDSDVLVEYSPGHINNVADIAALYPDCPIVHVVRDGRQVAARLASPLHVDQAPAEAARVWIDDQRAVDEIADHPLLSAVRIEGLDADVRTGLTMLAEAFGLDADADDIERAVDAMGPPLPAIPSGQAGAIVDIAGADLLVRYGYGPEQRETSARLAAWAHLTSSAAGNFARRVASDGVSVVVERARSVASTVRRTDA